MMAASPKGYGKKSGNTCRRWRSAELGLHLFRLKNLRTNGSLISQHLRLGGLWVLLIIYMIALWDNATTSSTSNLFAPHRTCQVSLKLREYCEKPSQTRHVGPKRSCLRSCTSERLVSLPQCIPYSSRSSSHAQNQFGLKEGRCFRFTRDPHTMMWTIWEGLCYCVRWQRLCKPSWDPDW